MKCQKVTTKQKLLRREFINKFRKNMSLQTNKDNILLTDENLSDDDDFKNISEANYRRIREKSSKIGYADGITDGREKSFQTAFDGGYAAGLRTGFELEKLRKFFKSLSKMKNPREDLLKEKDIYDQMRIADTDDKYHLQCNSDVEPIEDRIKRQQIYIDDFLRRCHQALPLTTNLLASQKK